MNENPTATEDVPFPEIPSEGPDGRLMRERIASSIFGHESEPTTGAPDVSKTTPPLGDRTAEVQ